MQLFSQSFIDTPAILPCAVLPRQAKRTHKKDSKKPIVEIILSLSIYSSPEYVLHLYDHGVVVGDVGAVVAQELGRVVREDHRRLQELGLVLLQRVQFKRYFLSKSMSHAVELVPELS